MADLHCATPLTIEFPMNPVYRIARNNQLLTGSKIRPQDSSSQAGHRFEPLPFFELENPKTHAYLDVMLAKELHEFGYYSPLDVSMIRGSDRRITRAIASLVSNQMDSNGEFIYSGIHYFSRLGDWECWAIFEETDIEIVETREIKVSDPDLSVIAALYQLTIH